MQALLSLLRIIEQHSQQLLNCLKQEKQALDTNQLEKLQQISEEKQALLVQLNQLDSQRADSSSSKDFNAFIANSQNESLIEQWHDTREIIAQCQKQNSINGRLLSKRSEINQDMLSILTGQKQQTDGTYNAQGNQTNKTTLLNNIKA